MFVYALDSSLIGVVYRFAGLPCHTLISQSVLIIRCAWLVYIFIKAVCLGFSQICWSPLNLCVFYLLQLFILGLPDLLGPSKKCVDIFLRGLVVIHRFC